MSNNDKLNLFQQVRELPKQKAVAFSAALLTRMHPNYALFCDINEFGDAKSAQNSLNLVWEWLLVPKAKINFAVHLERIEENTPDTDDFDNYGVYPAIDFCMALAATINLIMGDDEQGAVVVSKLSQGSVEAFILASVDEDIDASAIKAHPMMVFELAVQQELLDNVAIGKEYVKTIKALSASYDMSNIGVDIER